MQVVEVPVAEITIPPDRFRETIDPFELDELRVSIASIAAQTGTSGLLHPIVIDRQKVLIAGHRRLLATKLLGRPTIEASYLEDLDPLTRKIIEYDENRRRANLSWQEDAKAIAEIHDLRMKMDSDWTLQKTADELNVSIGKVHENIQLANAIGADTFIPDDGVKKILNRPTRIGALITLKREKEAALLAELARRQAALPENNNDEGRVICEDARVALDLLDADSIDLVITDPPWLIDVGQTSQVAKLKAMGYSDMNDDAVVECFKKLCRVMKPGRHLYCFVSADDLQLWHDRLHAGGFKTRSRPLIWIKDGWHGISDPYRRFMTGYDAIIWGFKPDDQGDYRNFIQPVKEIASYAPPSSWHPAAKPSPLLRTWIEASSLENEMVLDPFCGSGTTLIAALHAGRRFIGIEEDIATADQCVADLDAAR